MEKILPVNYKMLIKTMAIFALLLSVSAVDAQDYRYYQNEEGLVVIEAEKYSEILQRDGSNWNLVSEPVEYSAEGAMQAEGGPFASDSIANVDASVLRYNVEFNDAGDYYIWARASHLGGGDDSYHAGIDGIISLRSAYINFENTVGGTGVWVWTHQSRVGNGTYKNQDPAPAVIPVIGSGTHYFEIYIREKEFKIDKIVLTTNPEYVPYAEGDTLGVGPDEATLVGINKIKNNDFHKLSVYPNPVNDVATISYDLTRNENVKISLVNLVGEEVCVLKNENQVAGSYKVGFHTNKITTKVPSGMYFIQLKTNSSNSVARLLIE